VVKKKIEEKMKTKLLKKRSQPRRLKVLVDIPEALEALRKGTLNIHWSQCRLYFHERENSEPRCFNTFTRGI
jgi:hypothetical protein